MVKRTMNDTQTLRNEYRRIRRQTLQTMADMDGDPTPAAEFDNMVADRLGLASLEPTPINWVKTAKVVSQKVEAEYDKYIEYLANKYDDDGYNSYDTREERNMVYEP